MFGWLVVVTGVHSALPPNGAGHSRGKSALTGPGNETNSASTGARFAEYEIVMTDSQDGAEPAAPAPEPAAEPAQPQVNAGEAGDPARTSCSA
jgi:hypothetical protein